MVMTQREKQMAEAEAILGDSSNEIGFAAGLFFGKYIDSELVDYPDHRDDESTEQMLEKLQSFCNEQIDPVAIDRDAIIPESVIQGLGNLGVLGACLPTECGGRGMTQAQYCRVIELLGGHCGSTALFVNAHHSIGPRALVLFGTEEQQTKWLPKMATGQSISAFALTEPEAGSDAANVQTIARYDPDRKGFILNGEKRWITNGGIAQALTVMARQPDEPGLADQGNKATKISAFLVSPDMPGFRVVEQRMEKLGVRGTATSRLEFKEMFVPEENLLGKLGKGLRIALTVLDFGRTTFGASCTGSAKFCRDRARDHANTRVQFDQPIGSFELVKKKIAYMDAGIFAMEAATYQTAALIDSGAGEYMIETAMLKIFTTEVLWNILTDTFQIHGGLAYFTDQPFERMVRDARINTIGEGANDVLRAFIALVGMREVGLELQGIAEAFMNPLANLIRLGGFAGKQLGKLLTAPKIAVRWMELEQDAQRVGKLIQLLGNNVQRVLAKYREDIVDAQYQLSRIGNAATEIYVCSCVLSRLEQMHHSATPDELEKALLTARYYLKMANRRVHQELQDLWDNDDEHTTQLADMVMER